METLNESRLSIVLQRYLADGRVLAPPEANQREPVFFGGTNLFLFYNFFFSSFFIEDQCFTSMLYIYFFFLKSLGSLCRSNWG